MTDSGALETVRAFGEQDRPEGAGAWLGHVARGNLQASFAPCKTASLHRLSIKALQKRKSNLCCALPRHLVMNDTFFLTKRPAASAAETSRSGVVDAQGHLSGVTFRKP